MSLLLSLLQRIEILLQKTLIASLFSDLFSIVVIICVQTFQVTYCH